MVKRLMNNPWFVGALGLFASIYLGWSVAQPLFFDGTDFSADALGIEFNLSDDFAEDRDTAGRSAPQRENIRWLHDVERDPFAGMAYAMPDAEQPAGLPRVGALFISQGVRAAVVENRLVHVGDSVAQYTVTAIGEDFVELQHRGKALRVHPEA